MLRNVRCRHRLVRSNKDIHNKDRRGRNKGIIRHDPNNKAKLVLRRHKALRRSPARNNKIMCVLRRDKIFHSPACNSNKGRQRVLRKGRELISNVRNNPDKHGLNKETINPGPNKTRVHRKRARNKMLSSNARAEQLPVPRKHL